MPIKIPKGFQRRKSSGNVLDETQASEPSFKVFSRPESGHKSLDFHLAQQKPLPARKNSYEQEDEDLFTVMRPDAANRGSGGTTTSLSTAPYDSGASSTRLSSSSTIPSSIDARSDRNVHSTTATHNEPSATSSNQPKSSGFLRNAGRTFSFGVKPKSQEGPEQPVTQVPASRGRVSFSNGHERVMTTSSTSTATPPRLLDSDISIDNSGFDQFENMFDGIGSKSKDQSPMRTSRMQNAMTPAGTQVRIDTAQAGRSAQLQSTTTNRSAHPESSPYSWTSDNSRDALINTPSSVNTVLHNSPQPNSGRAFGKAMRDTSHQQRADISVEDNMFADTPSRPRADSRPNRPSSSNTNALPSSIRYTTSSHSSTARNPTSMQTSPILENEDAVFDPALLASAQLATRFQESKPVPATPSTNKKVMTPAEFERYKQQQDERHRMNKVFKNTKPEDDESDDNYEDVEEDDETERDRQAAKQRRKQEAHLAVYRQTMIKVTGEGPAPSNLPNKSTSGGLPISPSATDLANQFSSIGFDRSPARSSDEDEDDDVPLGILAAHGFPNKNKPPNRLASSTSNPNLRTIVNQQGPGSVAGESAKRGSLPVFARHLPEDPYYGAGLVNQSNRESLAMNSANLMPSGAATAHPHHPAGLVGVIAGEERARAMRRGSPNAATGTYDLPPSMPVHPEMVRAQTTGSMPNMMMPGMPGMPPMPMLSPGDHAQIQMSQQMSQMMQMQMQWMQQMSQFMTSHGPNAGPPPMMPNQMMPNLPVGANMPRPQSVPLQNQAGSEQRTMSLLSPPSMLGWNRSTPSFHNGAGSTYAPSIAPSERSNIGLASRYRPVSTMQEPEQPWNRRTSTMTSSTFRPFSQFGGGLKQPSATVRKVATVADDEDDEKGWAEMKAKKDQKKKTWKLRKGQNVLQELYNGTS